MGLETELAAVKVHIVGNDVPAPNRVTVVRPQIRTVVSKVTTSATSTSNQAFHLLPLAPLRCRATITVIGQSTDVVYLCMSKGDAQNLQGAPIMGLQVVTVEGSNELHIGAAPGVAVVIGVVADYEAS